VDLPRSVAVVGGPLGLRQQEHLNSVGMVVQALLPVTVRMGLPLVVAAAVLKPEQHLVLAGMVN